MSVTAATHSSLSQGHATRGCHATHEVTPQVFRGPHPRQPLPVLGCRLYFSSRTPSPQALPHQLCSTPPHEVIRPLRLNNNVVLMDIEQLPTHQAQSLSSKPAAAQSSLLLVLKPNITNTHTKSYCNFLPTNLRCLFRFWRCCAHTIKNEAIHLVNEVNSHHHPNLNLYTMYPLLANENSAFLKKPLVSQEVSC